MKASEKKLSFLVHVTHNALLSRVHVKASLPGTMGRKRHAELASALAPWDLFKTEVPEALDQPQSHAGATNPDERQA